MRLVCLPKILRLKIKLIPRIQVEKNVERFKEQLSIIGLDYDWSREINTTDPAFYKWTQMVFLKMFEKRFGV